MSSLKFILKLILIYLALCIIISHDFRVRNQTFQPTKTTLYNLQSLFRPKTPQESKTHKNHQNHAILEVRVVVVEKRLKQPLP